jgi:hypothetical protein
MDFNLMKMVLSLCQLLNSAYKLAPKVIYAELHIWSKDSQGNDLLTSLKQKGIGAIYLNHEDTPFKISDIGTMHRENYGLQAYTLAKLV